MPELHRRGFLTALSAALAGSVLDPERLLWVPGRTAYFVMPPAGNHFVSDEWISREFLRVASNNLRFTGDVSWRYDVQVGQTVTVRLPARYCGYA